MNNRVIVGGLGGSGGLNPGPTLVGSACGNGGTGGDGGNGGAGRGGAVFASGTVAFQTDNFTTNSATAGNGGAGGPGGPDGGGTSQFPASGTPGASGNGGNGGDAQGGALVSPVSVDAGTAFSGNTVVAGTGGTAGTLPVAGIVAPPGAYGPNGVAGANGTASDPDTFKPGQPPTVDAVEPGGGPVAGGNLVKVSGTNLNDPSLSLQSVSFDLVGGGSVDGVNPVVVSDGEVDVTAPDVTADLPAGKLAADSRVTLHYQTAAAVGVDSVPAASGDDAYAFGAPIVDSVSPEAGPLAGGNVVTIDGSGFQSPNLTFFRVVFLESDGSLVTGVNPQVVSDSQVTVTAPDATGDAGPGLTLDTLVRVDFKENANPALTDDSVPSTVGANAYSFGAPVVDAVEPGGGPVAGGNLVKVSGTNLNDPSLSLQSVSFDLVGGGSVDGVNPVVVSDGEVDVTAPDVTADLPAGKLAADSRVTLHYQTAAAVGVDSVPAASGDDAYAFGAPIVDSVSPEAGPLAGGNVVTIDGSGFQSPNLTFFRVVFLESDGSLVTGVNPQVVSDSQVTVTAPDATGDAGPGLTLDTLVRVDFKENANPALTDDSVPSTVGANAYSFGAPVVDAVEPGGGPVAGGNLVKVSGTNLNDPSLSLQSVSFDLVGGGSVDGVNPVVVSDGEVDVTAPDMTGQIAAGHEGLDTTITLHYQTADGTSVDSTPAAQGDDAYVFGAPIVDSVSPEAGPLAGGNVVTVGGSGFANPNLTFTGVVFELADGSTIDGVNPQVVSDSQVTVTAPDATSAANGQSTLDTNVTVQFTVNADPSNHDDSVAQAVGDDAYSFGAPVVDAVEPGGGPVAGGNLVKVSGTNLNDPSLSLQSVSFDLVGGGSVDGVNPVVVSDGEVDVTAPDVTADLPAGKLAADSRVTLHYQTAAAVGVDSVPAASGDDAYAFGAPIVDSVSPEAGPLAGGNVVTIDGSGFQSPNLTFFRVVFLESDGSLVTGVNPQVVSDSQVTVTAPDATGDAGPGLTLDTLVRVDFKENANPALTDDSVPSTVGANAYSFGAPVVDAVEPGGGPVAGGNLVKVSGTNLNDPSLSLQSVSFDLVGGGSVDGVNPVVVSDGEVDVTAPDMTGQIAAGHEGLDTTITLHYETADGTSVDSTPAAQGDDAYVFGAPIVDSVSPEAGPLAGGNVVTVGGSGFANPNLTFTGVVFELADGSTIDGVNPQVVSDSQVTVTAPDATSAANGQSTLDTNVTVQFTVNADPSNHDDSVAQAVGDDAYSFGAPVVDAVEPGGGPVAGGNLVKVSGTNLNDPSLSLQSVSFDLVGGGSVDGVNPVVVSDGEVDVTAPDMTGQIAAGHEGLDTTITLHYQTADGTSVDSTPAAQGDDAYVFGAPIVDSVSPEAGPLAGGNVVTVGGSGFANPNLTFTGVVFELADGSTIDGVNPQVVSDSQVTVTAPDATSAANGQSTLDTNVTVQFTVNADPSNHDDSVAQAVGDDAYSFGAPVVDAVEPGGGPVAGGNLVKVSGTNLNDPSLSLQSVSFDLVGGGSVDGVNPVVVSDGEVDVTAPDMTGQIAAGHEGLDTTITLHYQTADGTSVDSTPAAQGDDAYVFGAPIVDSVSPEAGPLAGGNVVTIGGSGFANPNLTFTGVVFELADGSTIDGVNPQVVSDSQVTVTAPDATSAANGQSTLDTNVTVQFTVNADPSNHDDSVAQAVGDDAYLFGAPVVASVQPSAGPLGGANVLKITGSGFQTAGLTLAGVSFDPPGDNGSAAIAGLSPVIVSDTEVDVTAPDATAAAQAGGLDTYVTVQFDVTGSTPGATDDSVPAAPGDNDYVFGTAPSSPVITGASGNGGSPSSSVTTSPGGQVTVGGGGFGGGQTVTATLHSAPVLLATATADAHGLVAFTVTIPLTTPVGLHQLVLTDQGSGQSATLNMIVIGGAGGGSGGGATSPVPSTAIARIAGNDRIATAIAASQDQFPSAHSAGSVVLARSDLFADALTGTPLAAAHNGPLLLTNSDTLDPAVQAEIVRVLPAGATVYVLGGPAAITPALDATLSRLGFAVVRYAGADRFGTATMVASQGLSDPSTILLVTGLDFPDGLAGGPAASAAHGAILLTNGPNQAPTTAAYLAAHPSDVVRAIGGPAVAADPAATAIAGSDRYATAVAVAAAFFPKPSVAGIATGAAFPDALSGGAEMAKLGGPLLLTDPRQVPADVIAYLEDTPSITRLNVFGGPNAIPDSQLSSL